MMAFGALLVLVATAVYWAVLGAKIQYGNADQLVDSYLFSSQDTFAGAHFPATHSFLLKWPLFLVGALPHWPHSTNWGYYPSGGIGLLLVVVVVLLLTQRI